MQRSAWSVANDARASYDGTEHGRWFFGSGDQPMWAGYSIGFALVSSYLARHPGTTAASLVDAAAAHIIAESGYDP